MQGFRIKVNTQDDLTGIRFRIYDNGQLAIDNVGAVDFQYLPEMPYEGNHTLELSYFDEELPGLESNRMEILSRNFTLRKLTLEVSCDVF